MFKNLLKWMGQRLLGLDAYLFLFSWLAGLRLRKTRHDPEFRHFLSLIPQQGLVLDIGANIGIMTVALAKARPGCRIYAFEPIPPNLRVLERVIAWYKLRNVQVYPVALGNKQETIKMILPEVNGILMQGLSHIIDPAAASGKGRLFSVQAERADDIPALQTAEKIAAVKIDVENHEYFVLQGAIGLLQRHRPVIYCELWNDARRKECISLLEEIGYRTQVFSGGALKDYTDQESVNLFFIPSSR